MFKKNKTELNRNDKKYSQTDKTVKFILIITVSERLRSCCGPLAISGHRSEAILRNCNDRSSSEQLRACSDILSNALSGRPHQSQQSSCAALSSRATLIFL